MSLFHFKHKWEKGVKIAWAPPTHSISSANGNGLEVIALIMYGVTTFKQTCKICGKERTYEVIGKAG